VSVAGAGEGEGEEVEVEGRVRGRRPSLPVRSFVVRQVSGKPARRDARYNPALDSISGPAKSTLRQMRLHGRVRPDSRPSNEPAAP